MFPYLFIESALNPTHTTTYLLTYIPVDSSTAVRMWAVPVGLVLTSPTHIPVDSSTSVRMWAFPVGWVGWAPMSASSKHCLPHLGGTTAVDQVRHASIASDGLDCSCCCCCLRWVRHPWGDSWVGGFYTRKRVRTYMTHPYLEHISWHVGSL